MPEPDPAGIRPEQAEARPEQQPGARPQPPGATPEQPGSDRPHPRVGAPRRLMLAGERTQLAWWRTGLASIAVGLAIGKVIPQLSDKESPWAYTVVGVGYVLYGLIMIVFGEHRQRQIIESVRADAFTPSAVGFLGAMSIVAAVLGLATIGLVIFD